MYCQIQIHVPTQYYSCVGKRKQMFIFHIFILYYFKLLYIPSVNLEIFSVGLGGADFIFCPEIWNFGGSGKGAGCFITAVICKEDFFMATGTVVIRLVTPWTKLAVGTIRIPLLGGLACLGLSSSSSERSTISVVDKNKLLKFREIASLKYF